MRTIIILRSVYAFGQEQEIEFPVHGTHWKITDKENIEVYNKDDIVASFRSWQSVRFGDES